MSYSHVVLNLWLSATLCECQATYRSKAFSQTTTAVFLTLGRVIIGKSFTSYPYINANKIATKTLSLLGSFSEMSGNWTGGGNCCS